MKKLLLSSIPLLLLLFLFGIPDQSFAQQITPTVVCSGGETLTTTSLSLDFTVGEIATEPLTSGGWLLTQGFIQGPDPNTGVEENPIDEEDLIIYPNPAKNRICFFCKNTELKPVGADIRDLQGRIIFHAGFDINPLTVNLEDLAPGFYTVTVLFDSRQTINKKFIKQ